MARSAGAEVTHLELADFDVPMYNADLEAKGTPADVMKLKQIGYEHPAWIICTPEYNASYPALLEEHAGLDLQPGEERSGLERRFPLRPAARWSACSALRPAAWAACARKATWCPCCSTCTAGWRRKNFALGRAADAFD